MSAVCLQSIGEAIWEYSHAVRFCGVLLPHRMTVIRLGSGKLLLHSPTRCDQETIHALAKIGTVTEIVAPNRFHDLFLEDWLVAAPEARLWIPQGMDRCLSLLPQTEILRASQDALWQEDLVCMAVQGMPKLDEFAFYHEPSKTLIVADLVFNIESNARFATRLVARLGGFYRRLAMPCDLRFGYVRDREALKQSVQKIMNLPFDKVVIGHGANILASGKAEFRRALQWLSGDDR